MQKNGKYGFADKNGKMVIKARYDQISEFKDRFAATGTINEKDRKMGFINSKSKVVCQYATRAGVKTARFLVILNEKNEAS